MKHKFISQTNDINKIIYKYAQFEQIKINNHNIQIYESSTSLNFLHLYYITLGILLIHFFVVLLHMNLIQKHHNNIYFV